MPSVRVFVPTFRRPQLLRRALASLQAQTLQEWTCEVHNDDPADPSPSTIVEALRDHRITLINHERNLGPVATFNLFFQATREPFYSLLEDDNWWHPQFLSTMQDALIAHPDCTIAWCNQQVWEEMPDGSWRDTRHTVHENTNAEPQQVPWANPTQAIGALHANGAMLIRSQPGQNFRTTDVPFTGIEAIRERLFPHPLLYIAQPLAYFSVTQQSARNRDLPIWLAFQTALLATFVKRANLDAISRADLWRHYRATPVPPTTAFLCAGLGCKECRPFLREARIGEWWRMIRAAVRHPGAWWHAVRVQRHFPEWWKQLDSASAARFSEAGSHTKAAQPTM